MWYAQEVQNQLQGGSQLEDEVKNDTSMTATVLALIFRTVKNNYKYSRLALNRKQINLHTRVRVKPFQIA